MAWCGNTALYELAVVIGCQVHIKAKLKFGASLMFANLRANKLALEDCYKKQFCWAQFY